MQNGITFLLLLLAFFVFLAIALTYVLHLFVSPSTETPESIRKEIIEKIALHKLQKFADLGSGNGAFLIDAAKLAQIQGIGYEISPIIALLSRVKALYENIFKKAKINVKFEIADFFTQNFVDVDVIYLHQHPKVMKNFERLANGLLAQGHKIFAYEHPFPTIKPIETYKLSNGKNLYEY
jgi:SAM-dependent methyltransferase